MPPYAPPPADKGILHTLENGSPSSNDRVVSHAQASLKLALALLKNGSRNADRSFSDSTFFLEQGRIPLRKWGTPLPAGRAQGGVVRHQNEHRSDP
jgi:hypothetical protein